MVKKILSLKGRISRKEYIISVVIYFVLSALWTETGLFWSYPILFELISVPFGLTFWLQAVKRSHDVGNNGWWTWLPGYSIWLLFKHGDTGANKYGESPIQLESVL